LVAADGLKYYDLVEGKGPTAEKGSTVQVKLVTSAVLDTSSYILLN
jgi:FKBP-type peptidyl-prolyl cis-trans isomerase